MKGDMKSAMSMYFPHYLASHWFLSSDKAPIAIICLSLLSFLLPWCTYGNLLTSVSDRGTREWQRSDDRIGGMGWQLYLPVSWTVWRRVNVYTSNLSSGTIAKWLAPMGCCHVMAAGLNWKNSKGEVCPLTHRGHCNIIADTEKGEKKVEGFKSCMRDQAACRFPAAYRGIKFGPRVHGSIVCRLGTFSYCVQKMFQGPLSVPIPATWNNLKELRWKGRGYFQPRNPSPSSGSELQHLFF